MSKREETILMFICAFGVGFLCATAFIYTWDKSETTLAPPHTTSFIPGNIHMEHKIESGCG